MLVASACSDQGPERATAAAELASTTTVAPSTTSTTAPTTTAAPTTTSSSTTVVADSPGPSALDLVPLPAQPAGVPFPTVAWPEADPSEVLDSDGAAALAEVVDRAFDEADPYGRIEGVLVVAEGRIVAERYGRGYDGADPHVSWSVAKSVTHAMLGIVAGEGRLDVDAPAPVPEWSDPDDPRAAITPAQLARMSSGLQWNEVVDATSLVGRAPSIEAGAEQAARPLASEPNTTFNYSTGSTAINGRILGDLVGTGAEFAAWAEAELFDPLGIGSVELELDGSGYFIAGYGANMTARDFARFGLLYLRDGVWDGQRILPAGWVDDARTPSDTSAIYGAGFWLAGDVFSAAGFLGQRIVIDPEHDVIVVILAQELATDPITDLAADLIAPFDDS